MATAGLIGTLPDARKWWWLAGMGAAIHALVWSISEPNDLFSDFFKAYFPVAERLWQSGPVPTWETDEPATLGFVNLPILAFLFVPLAFAGEAAAGWVFLAFGAAAVVAAFALFLRLGRFDAAGGALLALCILANGPLVNSLREGNTTHFVLLLLLLALLLWRAGAQFSAGLLIGFCALIKLPLMLLGMYFVFRGRWRVVTGGATAICGALLLSFAVFGVDINVGWYRHSVEPFLGGVMPAFNVQSIDGFLARLASGPEHLTDWTPLAPPLWHKIARNVILFAMFVPAFLAMYRSSNRPIAGGRASEPDMREFSIVLVLAVVTSPLSWTHYYALLLLPFALYLGGSLGLPDDSTTRRLMAGGMLLASLPVVILPLEPDLVGAIASRTIASAWLFGGLLMLAALVRGLVHAREPAIEARRQMARL